MEDDMVVFDLEKNIKVDLPEGSLVCLFYRDGTARTGKLVAHMDGKCVIENVDAGYRNGKAEFMTDISYTKVFVPYSELKEYGIVTSA